MERGAVPVVLQENVGLELDELAASPHGTNGVGARDGDLERRRSVRPTAVDVSTQVFDESLDDNGVPLLRRVVQTRPLAGVHRRTDGRAEPVE